MSSAAAVGSRCQILCEEPFRVFFPVGVLGGLAGGGLWFAPSASPMAQHLGLDHGLLQVQTFLMSFAVGFLMTSLPRFVEGPRSRPWEILLNLGLLVAAGLAALTGRWRLAEVAFLLLVLHLLVFAVRRFHAGQDNPPAPFVFVPVGLLCGLVGALFMLFPPGGFIRLGPNLLEQALFLCLVMAVGSHLGPRLLHGEQRYPETSGPRFHRLVWIFGGYAALLLLTFPLEAGPMPRLGRLLRGLLLLGYFLAMVRIHRLPYRPRWHLYLLWLSFWAMPAGLLLAALFPAYELAALHVTFVGGFGLMTVVVATRVVVAHCDFEALWERNAPSVGVAGTLVVLAMAGRLAADLVPRLYLPMLHAGAGLWTLALLWWGLTFVPRMGPGHVSPDD